MDEHEIAEAQMAIVRTQKPYLLDALRRWGLDKGGSPHVVVDSTWPGTSGVPPHLIHGNLVLNVDERACPTFLVGNEWLELKMAFNGHQCHLFIPIAAVKAVFVPELENSGMSFESFHDPRPDEAAVVEVVEEEAPARPSFLTVVK